MFKKWQDKMDSRPTSLKRTQTETSREKLTEVVARKARQAQCSRHKPQYIKTTIAKEAITASLQ